MRLVDDDTVPRAQAGRVATTLAERLPARGGRGSHGRTLAHIAEAEGVSRADLVKGLVAAAEEQPTADVAAGGVARAQADDVATGLTGRTTATVDRVGGPRGHRDRGGDDAPAPGATTATPSPPARPFPLPHPCTTVPPATHGRSPARPAG